MKFEEIKELLLTINQLQLSEVNIETKEVKFAVKKMSKDTMDSIEKFEKKELENKEAEKTNQQIPIANKIIVDDPNMVIVESPIVGTIYLMASPGEDQFVDIGKKIKKGQSLCIIEAMKLMNELRSEIDGTVVEIFVRNEQPVQFGQPLMLIRK